MRRYLVVANQTLQRAELADELRKRIEEGPSSFYLLVPDTRAADYPDVAAAPGVLQPSMTWWMTDYRGPATDEEASTQARQRLGQIADLELLPTIYDFSRHPRVLAARRRSAQSNAVAVAIMSASIGLWAAWSIFAWNRRVLASTSRATSSTARPRCFTRCA